MIKLGDALVIVGQDRLQCENVLTELNNKFNSEATVQQIYDFEGVDWEVEDGESVVLKKAYVGLFTYPNTYAVFIPLQRPTHGLSDPNGDVAELFNHSPVIYGVDYGSISHYENLKLSEKLDSIISFVFDTEDEASWVLDMLKSNLRFYGRVSVGDLYDTIGTCPDLELYKYEWKELKDVDVVKVGQRYTLSLPTPMFIDKPMMNCREIGKLTISGLIDGLKKGHPGVLEPSLISQFNTKNPNIDNRVISEMYPYIEQAKFGIDALLIKQLKQRMNEKFGSLEKKGHINNLKLERAEHND